jgi:hypothetical protein
MTARTLFLILACTLAPALRAWDYDGHRIVNQLALRSLPAEFPAFVREPATAERIAFLAGEPDRWRNVPDLPLRQYNGLDHYFDLEQVPAAGLDVATLPSFRYDFAMQFAAGRAAHPEKFPAIDPAGNSDHSREWCGFLPWAITEQYGKLRAAFSYLKVFEELGTAEEIADARANLAYQMGVMGHYVGDVVQPLHTTVHHHGWTGPNPAGYTTWSGFHSWIDGSFIEKSRLNTAELAVGLSVPPPLSLAPRRDGRDPVFVAMLDFAIASNKLVEPLYQLEKAGKLGNGEQPISTDARAFIGSRLRTGGEMLARIWLTAWRSAVPDTFLRAALLKRRAGKANPTATPAKK